jgi:hypothetical protein
MVAIVLGRHAPFVNAVLQQDIVDNGIMSRMDRKTYEVIPVA